tara:strand:- start:15009 stop:15230 length:222 start_codon:yes stop_codon:yes gene_type:complete
MSTIEDMQKKAYNLQNEINRLSKVRSSAEYLTYSNLKAATMALRDQKAELIDEIRALEHFQRLAVMMEAVLYD